MDEKGGGRLAVKGGISLHLLQKSCFLVSLVLRFLFFFFHFLVGGTLEHMIGAGLASSLEE